jgi:hypothetical protein
VPARKPSPGADVAGVGAALADTGRPTVQQQMCALSTVVRRVVATSPEWRTAG